MKSMKNVKKYWPVILCIIAIFALTMQSVSSTMGLSNFTLSLFTRFMEALGLNTADAWWNDSINFRQLAHIFEFGFLGLVAGLLIKRPLPAVGICACISLADQTLKIFVPVRHFDYVDLIFDAVGYVLAVALIHTIRKIKHKKR